MHRQPPLLADPGSHARTSNVLVRRLVEVSKIWKSSTWRFAQSQEEKKLAYKDYFNGSNASAQA